MIKNNFITIILIAVLVITIFLWTGVFSIWAQGDPGVVYKLNKILEGQSQILNLLNEIKSELSSIKSRL